MYSINIETSNYEAFLEIERIAKEANADVSYTCAEEVDDGR